MILDLSSARAKLNRATEHAKAVESEIRAWGDTQPYSLTYETNADSTRYSVFIKFNGGATAAPIERWSLMIADSIHNFRCALDHLVYSVAIAESGQDPPPLHDVLMFPICDNNTSFDREIKRRGLECISPPMRAIFELFQPYNRPYPKLPPLLAMLRDFENANKHRLLQLLFGAVSSGNIGFTGPPVPPETIVTLWAQAGEIKDGTEVVAFTFDRPTPNMQYDRSEIMMVFALPHKKAVDGTSNRDDATTLMHIIGEEISTLIDSVAANIRV